MGYIYKNEEREKDLIGQQVSSSGVDRARNKRVRGGFAVKKEEAEIWKIALLCIILNK